MLVLWASKVLFMTVSALSTWSHERSVSNFSAVLFIFGISSVLVTTVCVLWLVALPGRLDDVTSEEPKSDESGFVETLDAMSASCDFVVL